MPTGVTINFENVFGFGFKGPAAFSRTTNGGTSWEPLRLIYTPGANNQTIGNQIVVLPASRGGTVIDFFNEILNFRSTEGGVHSVFNLSFLTSADKGTTWRPNGQPNRAQSMQSMALFRTFGILTPDTGAARAFRRHSVRRRGGPEQRQPVRRLAGRPLQPTYPR